MPSRPTVMPRIITEDVAGLGGFLQTVLDATGEVRTDRPTELRLGDSILMISDGGVVRQPTTAFLYTYVDDVDDRHDRAVAAGARSIEAPGSTGYGDRRATVEDPWGNTWQLATPDSIESGLSA